MFKRFPLRIAAFLASLLFLVAPEAFSVVETNPVTRNGLVEYKLKFTSADVAGTISIPIRACHNMTVFWERSNATVVSAYSADSDDDTEAEIEANTPALDQFTATEKADITPTKAYVRFVVDTVTSGSVPSTAVVVCSEYAHEGAGGSGLANVVEDLTPTLGGDLDANQFGITDLGNVTQNPPVDTALHLAPSHTTPNDEDIYFANDGSKNLLVDVYNSPATGGGAQAACLSGSPPCGDGYADSDGSTQAGKTKVYGREIEVATLTENESYGQRVFMLGGGDVDGVGQETYAYCTGGAQDDGDEGCQAHRVTTSDSYYNVDGVISGTIAAGSGTATLTVGSSSLSVTESKLVGENKLLVFDTNASSGAVADTINVVTLPAGTINASGVETGSWSTGAKTWEIENGIVASSGIGGGWCVAPTLSAYKDYNGFTHYMWFEVASSGDGDGSMDTIVTNTWIQGVNHGIARGTLAETGTDKLKIAPCVKIVRPTIDNATKLATSILVDRATGFDGTGSGEDFVVSEYPNHKLAGATFIVKRTHGAGQPQEGVQSVNLFATDEGRYRGAAAFTGTFSGPLANVDGTKHAWNYGLYLPAGGALTGIQFSKWADTADTYTNMDRLANVTFTQEDYDDDYPWPIISVGGATELNSGTKNLTFDKSGNWGMYDDPFMLLNATQTITGAKTYTGVNNFASGTLRIPSSTTLPATCTTGDQYMDTDASAGSRLYLCEAADTWVAVADGIGGGGSDVPITVGGSPLNGPTAIAFASASPGLNIVGTEAGATDSAEISFDYSVGYGSTSTVEEIVFSSQGTGSGGFRGEGQTANAFEYLWSIPLMSEATADAEHFFVMETIAQTLTNKTLASPVFSGTASGADTIPSSLITTELRSMWFGAAGLSVDGTHCVTPAEVTINSGPKLYTTICADNDAASIYGSTTMPDGWDGGTVTFEHVYLQTAADTGPLNGDIAAQCRGNGEVPSSTWGTEVAIDDAAVVGSNSNDHTTSAAVTPAGTCAAGDTLYWRYQLDATGTTTAVATLHTLGFKMEYTSNVGD